MPSVLSDHFIDILSLFSVLYCNPSFSGSDTDVVTHEVVLSGEWKQFCLHILPDTTSDSVGG